MIGGWVISTLITLPSFITSTTSPMQIHLTSDDARKKERSELSVDLQILLMKPKQV